MSKPSNQNPLLPSDLPRLSDTAAVEILDFLHELVFRFEARYAGQIHRYYDQQRQDESSSKTTTAINHSDPPF